MRGRIWTEDGDCITEDQEEKEILRKDSLFVCHFASKPWRDCHQVNLKYNQLISHHQLGYMTTVNVINTLAFESY